MCLLSSLKPKVVNPGRSLFDRELKSTLWVSSSTKELKTCCSLNNHYMHCRSCKNTGFEKCLEGCAMITNLQHQDQVDLQQYIEENCLTLYANSQSENTESRKYIVKMKFAYSHAWNYGSIIPLCNFMSQNNYGLYLGVKWNLYTKAGKNLGVWHVSVNAIPSFICRMFNECQNMLLCCTVSQTASISLWFIQVTEK